MGATLTVKGRFFLILYFILVFDYISKDLISVSITPLTRQFIGRIISLAFSPDFHLVRHLNNAYDCLTICRLGPSILTGFH